MKFAQIAQSNRSSALTALNSTTATDLSSKLAALHAVPGLKDADITTNTRKNSLIRTTSTAADAKRLLRNARRQARRRTSRLEAKLAALELDTEATESFTYFDTNNADPIIALNERIAQFEALDN